MEGKMQEPLSQANDRLYLDLARWLTAELVDKNCSLGSRMLTERELLKKCGVSRPTVREAIIALEVQCLVKVRVGSGATCAHSWPSSMIWR
jgi:GntR family transcriptional repressor for pyruvate dehydrogenase complex